MELHNPALLPLIPDQLLRQAQVHEPHDSRFRAAARLQQALWRARRQLPAGSYTDAAGRRRRLGSRLAPEAARAGANFLTPAIFGQARCDLAYREPGALLDAERMHENLLSSAPLCFNLLAPLKTDPALARRVCASLAPGVLRAVSCLQFEHSPGRGDPAFTADGTAFDAILTGRGPGRAKSFLAIEVKFSESMTEPEARLRPRYDTLAQSSGLYADPDDAALRRNPLQSLWRAHMLAQSMVDADLFDAGVFMLIAPRQNRDVQRAARAYAQRLSHAPGKVAFLNVELEDAIAAFDKAGASEHAAALHERYTDFTPVHRLVQDACFAAPRRQRPRHTRPRRAQSPRTHPWP